MHFRFQAKAAWPLNLCDNQKFWNYVYAKGKNKQVESCLKHMNFSFTSKSYLYDVVSPAPFDLINALYSQGIFSKQELEEMIRHICNGKEFTDMLCIIRPLTMKAASILPNDGSNSPTPPPNGPNGSGGGGLTVDDNTPFYGQARGTNTINYCLMALGLLLIAASFKLQIMLAIVSALAGTALVAVSVYSMQP
jgi:hypothetical protein